VRKTAFEKLTDQAVLADVAKNGKYYDVRKAAAEKLMGTFGKLTDPAVLADIVKNDKDCNMRIAAIENLISLECFMEALDGIYSFEYTWDKIRLAEVLVHAAQKSGPPLKMPWKNIKNWVEKAPHISHEDRPEDCPHDDQIMWNGVYADKPHTDGHVDARGTYAPKFPPYPILET
jgi:hypothetical protein